MRVRLEETNRPAPFLNSTLNPPSLLSRPARKPLPQSRGRINVWDCYSGEQEEDYNDANIMAYSNDVFELPGETQGSSAAPQPTEEPRNEQDISLQCEEAATKMVDSEVATTGLEPSMDSFSEIKPLSMQTEKAAAPPLPAATDDTERVFSLEGFMNQTNLAFEEKSPSQDAERDLGFFHGTAVPLKTEESHMVVATREDEASQAVSSKGLKGIGYHTKPESEDLALDLRGRKGLQEIQKAMSTHSSQYECSIIVVPKESSTRTSSPYSCVSCRNLGATESDRLEAEIHDLVRLSPQPDPGSADVPKIATDRSSTPFTILDQSQETPVSFGVNTSNEFQSQHSANVLLIFPRNRTVEQHTHDVDLTASSTAPVDNLAKSEEELRRTETSPSTAGLGRQQVDTPEMSDSYPQLTINVPLTSAKSLLSQSPPALCPSHLQ